MIDFLTALHPEGNGSFTELRMMRNGEVEDQFLPIRNRDTVLATANGWSKAGWDVYYGVLPRRWTRGRAEDCVLDTGVLWADIDNKSVGGTHLAALMRVGALNLSPSIIVDSGNGIHAYWLLRTPQPFEAVQPLMKGLQTAIGSDRVHDAPRVLRLPGTLNHKACDTEPMSDEQGAIPATHNCKPVRLLHFEPDRQYRLSDFDDYAPEEQRPALSETAYYAEGWEPSNLSAPKFPEGTRNSELTRLAGIMVAKGLKPIDMLAALLDENNRRCSPPLPAAEVERIVRSVQRYVHV